MVWFVWSYRVRFFISWPTVPLPASTPFRMASRWRDRVVEFLREGRVGGNLSEAALAGIDAGDELVGVFHGGVQVIVKSFILKELARAAFTSLQIGGDLIKPVDG